MATFSISRKLDNKDKKYVITQDSISGFLQLDEWERYITTSGIHYVFDRDSCAWFTDSGSIDNIIFFIPFERSIYTDRLDVLRKRMILEENGEEIFGKIFTFNRLFAHVGLPELLYEIVKRLFDLYLV